MMIKAIEPVLLLGAERFANLDIRVTVKGGGRVAQIYGSLDSFWLSTAIRQAISRAIVAFYQKCSVVWSVWSVDVDEQAKREIKDLLVSFDRSLIAAGSVSAVCVIARSSSLRAQEVRRSIGSCPLPEVLPINAHRLGCIAEHTSCLFKGNIETLHNTYTYDIQNCLPWLSYHYWCERSTHDSSVCPYLLQMEQ